MNEAAVTINDGLIAIAGIAFTSWAGVVVFLGRRIIIRQDRIDHGVQELIERVTRLEVQVAPGIPPPTVRNSLDDHENRLRKLEGLD